MAGHFIIQGHLCTFKWMLKRWKLWCERNLLKLAKQASAQCPAQRERGLYYKWEWFIHTYISLMPISSILCTFISSSFYIYLWCYQSFFLQQFVFSFHNIQNWNPGLFGQTSKVGSPEVLRRLLLWNLAIVLEDIIIIIIIILVIIIFIIIIHDIFGDDSFYHPFCTSSLFSWLAIAFLFPTINL